jgi:hypothetical protein
VSPPAARGDLGPAAGGEPRNAPLGKWAESTPGIAAEATFARRPEATLGERGGATLLGFAMAGVVLMAGIVSIDVGALAGARAAAQTAADMAALAALTPPDAQGGGVAVVGEAWGRPRRPSSPGPMGRSC